jgi:hypothetical protein
MAQNEEAKPKPGDETASETAAANKSGKITPKDWVAIILGAALVIGYLIFLFLMRSMINSEEVVWTRSVYLLSGLEAIAFAAAGYFFGSEVNRKAAESAKEDAETAKTDAKTAKENQADTEKKFVEARTKGLALKEAILAKSQGGRLASPETLGVGTRTKGVKAPGTRVVNVDQSDIGELAAFAENLIKE